ncbi:uncharacterized protein LOC134534206 isoform X2 [Bacillus rossius redtenbacheri]|uniref:uncharacterized protein LOC134534206 isoform X2 n=1 Tax=Bacillus rossius redtenbacheri TaxID=93214 RepID=UPI002FDDC755
MEECVWDPLAEVFISLSGSSSDEEDIFCLCSRVLIRNIKYQENDASEDEDECKTDAEEQGSRLEREDSKCCKLSVDRTEEDAGSCYCSASHTENCCSTDEDAMLWRGAAPPHLSDSGADLSEHGPPTTADAHWEHFWAVNGEKLIWRSWIAKYGQYIDPEYLARYQQSAADEDGRGEVGGDGSCLQSNKEETLCSDLKCLDLNGSVVGDETSNGLENENVGAVDVQCQPQRNGQTLFENELMHKSKSTPEITKVSFNECGDDPVIEKVFDDVGTKSESCREKKHGGDLLGESSGVVTQKYDGYNCIKVTDLGSYACETIGISLEKGTESADQTSGDASLHSKSVSCSKSPSWDAADGDGGLSSDSGSSGQWSPLSPRAIYNGWSHCTPQDASATTDSLTNVTQITVSSSVDFSCADNSDNSDSALSALDGSVGSCGDVPDQCETDSYWQNLWKDHFEEQYSKYHKAFSLTHQGDARPVREATQVLDELFPSSYDDPRLPPARESAWDVRSDTSGRCKLHTSDSTISTVVDSDKLQSLQVSDSQVLTAHTTDLPESENSSCKTEMDFAAPSNLAHILSGVVDSRQDMLPQECESQSWKTPVQEFIEDSDSSNSGNLPEDPVCESGDDCGSINPAPEASVDERVICVFGTKGSCGAVGDTNQAPRSPASIKKVDEAKPSSLLGKKKAKMMLNSVGVLLETLKTQGCSLDVPDAPVDGAAGGSRDEGGSPGQPCSEGAPPGTAPEAGRGPASVRPSGGSNSSDEEPPEERPINLKRSHEIETDSDSDLDKVKSAFSLMGYSFSPDTCNSAIKMEKAHVWYRKKNIKYHNRHLKFGNRPQKDAEQVDGMSTLDKVKQFLADVSDEEAGRDRDDRDDRPQAACGARPGPLARGESVDADLEEATEDADRKQQLRKKKKRQAKRAANLPEEIVRDRTLMKYWIRRYQLFSRFDEGIKLDAGNVAVVMMPLVQLWGEVV